MEKLYRVQMNNKGAPDFSTAVEVEDKPSVDKDHLIRLIQEAVYDGEACSKLLDLVDRPQGEWMPSTEDLIKRSDVINLLWYFQDEYCSAVVGDFEKLPSADRPQGEWIHNPNGIDRDFIWWKCSNCGHVIFSETEHDREQFHAFCGRCGARMKGADDE